MDTPSPDTPPDGTDAVTNVTASPSPAMGERMPNAVERFYLLANHTIGQLGAGEGPMPETNVPETLAATAFYQGSATAPQLVPWSTGAFGRAFETTGDIDLTVSFVSAQPAVNTLPKSIDFPPIGGWFGTPERFAFFVGASDAPDPLEAGKIYTVHLRAIKPTGGFFVRPGESLSLHLYSGYQSADNTPISWVVGGLDPAGFALPHQHFNLSAPRPTVVLEKTADIGPSIPRPSSSRSRSPPTHSTSRSRPLAHPRRARDSIWTSTLAWRAVKSSRQVQARTKERPSCSGLGIWRP
jgi:hypothetical protein